MIRTVVGVVAIGSVIGLPRYFSAGQAPNTVSCIPRPHLVDTMRFVGIARTELPPGALRMWVDSSGRLAYSQSWVRDTSRFVWEGIIGGVPSEPISYTQRRLRNGVELNRETVDRQTDSLVTLRLGNPSAVAIQPNVVAVPGLISSAVRFVLLHCAALRPGGVVETSRFGRVRSDVVATAQIRSGLRTTRAELRLLRDSTDEVIARAWFDADGKPIAMPYVEGGMDLIDPVWVNSRDQLVEAEIRASSPYCRSGFGFGTCEPGPRVCNLPTSTRTLPMRVRSVVVSDSGYSIRSDGRGPYFVDSANVIMPPVGVVAGILLRRPPLRGSGRAFVVDLSKPVPGNIGRPLGLVTVDGTHPGWAPAGSTFINELVVHANTDWDQQQHSLAAIPIRSSSVINQLSIDFYIDGVLHLFQIGPQPYGHCYAAGTAVYGDGTSTATVSRPDSTRWVVDLPSGSKGRLFRNPHGDATAVNLGLYYISLRMEVRR